DHGDHAHDHGSHGQGMSLSQGPVADASVRLAKVSDAPAVGLVQAAVWMNAYAGLLPDAVLAHFQPPAFTSAWRASLNQPPTAAHRLLVACAGEQVVGLAAVGPSEDPDVSEADAELLVLGVHPGARRSGHGSRLLNAAVDTARGSRLETLRAWVPADATETRAFLTGGGFAADGAYRERAVGSDPDDVLREVRFVVSIAAD
ncbi:MAG: GNAT family N-acetyltransferase, partial [Lapillicoccus sp.]